MIRATIKSLMLVAVLVFAASSVMAQPWPLANQLTTHANWDLGTGAWEVGNSGGWHEADVVPHTYTVDADSTGGPGFFLDVCLESVVTQGPATYYGYVDANSYYHSVDPGVRLDDQPINGDDEMGPVVCDNCSLISVTALGLGAGSCDNDEELGFQVVFNVVDPAQTAHFFFGGKLGYPGAPIPGGGCCVDETNSPSNKGGVWQSRVESGGDKTTQITAPEPALAVEFTSFEAYLDGSDAVLSWATASETDNSGFSIEHSDNGGEFTEVAFVPGAGTTTEARSYEYTVNDIGAGLHRFRLKQIDFDGAFSYSAMVEVTSEVPGTHLLSEAYPNPFNPSTSFSLAVSRDQEVAINVYDMLGRHVSSLYRGALEANVARTFSVNAANWTSGTYTIVVEGEAFRDSRSLVLLK